MKQKPPKKAKTKKQSIVEVLGPVESLESYVKAEWWKEIFNAQYLKTDGDVVNDEVITEKEIDTILKILDPEKQSMILDLCCGQGRHSFELAKRGFSGVHGLDRSHYLINRARKLNKSLLHSIVFKEGDARKLPFKPDTFDYILILGNSFGYFESHNDDIKVLHEVARILKPGGTVLLDLTDGQYMRTNFEPRSWEWIDKNYFVCRERSLSNDNERLISREVITHIKKGVIADQFYAERLYNEASIKEILHESKFDNAIFHDILNTKSSRNQDLGMMARRIIVTAQIHKISSPKPVREKTFKNILVLLGDPTLSDVVKPDAKFDDDDFFTISSLKKALQEVSQYNFTYFDNHHNLINYLVNQRQKFDLVFNLCDEGFNNEAVKELHVPALLEILEIPYSGGNPQCLSHCYDKSLVRGIARELDIPVPDAFIIKPEDTTFIEFYNEFPVIVKPNFGDSSIGITQKSVCYNIEELEIAIVQIREKFGYEITILVEQFLTGKDISVGIIGNLPNNYTVLPIIEEDYSKLPPDLPKICGYEAKWDSNSPYWNITSIPANLPESTERYLEANCIKLFKRLNCRDYARFDWRLDDNDTPRLLEVNPNPGWCWDGHLAKMAKLDNISYSEMLKLVINSAVNRYSETNI